MSSVTAVTIRATELRLTLEQYIDKLHDPVFFALEIWHDRGLNRYGRLEKYEKRIIRWACLGPPKRGVLANRGLGKTYFGALVLCAWSLFCDPDCKILFVSKSVGHAKKSLSHVKDWIRTVPFLQHLYTNNIKDKRWSQLEIDVLTAEPSRTPSVTAMGIEGQLPGNRAYKIIADDVETDNTAKTAEGRENINDKTHEFMNIASYGNREICYFGTFFHEDSVYVKLHKLIMKTGPKAGERIYHFKTWSIVAPTLKESAKMINPDQLMLDEVEAGILDPGDRLFPHRPDHSLQAIAEHKALGPTHWCWQYMLIPGVMDELYYPLKLKDLIVFPMDRDIAPLSISWGMRDNNNQTTAINDIIVAPTDASLRRPIHWDQTYGKFTNTLMWIDPAGSGKDKTAYAIGAGLNGFIWIKEVHAFEPGEGFTNATLATIAMRAKWHRVRTIFIEKNFGQGMYIPLLQPYMRRSYVEPGALPDYPDGWSCSMEEAQASKQKELRICDALEGVMSQHRVVVDRKVAENQDLQMQLARITRQPKCLPHEDELEAMAMLVLQLKDTVEQDPDIAASRYKEEQERRLWEIEEEEWSDEPVKEPSWIQY